VFLCGIRFRLSAIEKLKYLNLEVSQGKTVFTKENINIKCRINPSEDHNWHTSNSQLNLIVDLIYNFFVTWGRRQDDINFKVESLHKEHQEQYHLIDSKLDLLLHKIEEVKGEQNTVCRNSDYIKEEATTVRDSLNSFLNNISTGKESLLISECSKTEHIFEVKGLIEEIRDLILCDRSKEIILSSSTKNINSEKWKYLKASLETKPSN